MKSIIVELKVKLLLETENKTNINGLVNKVIQEMDYDFSSNNKNVKIVNTEITDYDIIKIIL